jgi:hypothetical protein
VKKIRCQNPDVDRLPKSAKPLPGPAADFFRIRKNSSEKLLSRYFFR